jgi:hypothetical protein
MVPSGAAKFASSAIRRSFRSNRINSSSIESVDGIDFPDNHQGRSERASTNVSF